MMLHCHSSNELGQSDFNPCKFQTLQYLYKPACWISLGFNPRSHRRNPDKSSYGSRVFVGFKLQCVVNTLVQPPKKSASINGKKKKTFGGYLPSILRSLDTEDDVEKALNLYSGKLGPKEQTIILKEQGSWERVVIVFDWMRAQPDYVPNVIHYNVVLRTLGRAQRWDELRLCWIEMARDGILPTNNTYSMLIDVYGKAGLVNESLLWIKHMRVRGIFPDEVTMNTVVKVLKDAGEFDRADRFYKDWCVGKVDFQDIDVDDDMDEFASESLSKAISLKHFLSTQLFKIGGRYSLSEGLVVPEMENTVRKPRLTATYNTLIDLYGKAGRLNDAAEVFAEMLRTGVAPDTITFNTMIHTCGSHGHLSEAETLLSKMEERGLSPDTKTYNTLLSLHAQAGNMDAALQWYRKIRKVNLYPNVVTHRAVLHMLCEKQMVQEVKTVIREMEECHLCIDEHSIPGIVKMYVNDGLIEEARTFFEKCWVRGGLSSKTYAAIMDVYAEKGLWGEAEVVFYSKRDLAGQKKDVLEYNVMIKAFGKAKLYERAFSAFKGMRNFGTWPDDCTYNSLIQMFAGGDLLDQAKDVLTQMQESGLTPHHRTFSAMIAGYARLGLLSDAINILQEMSKAGLKPNEVVYGALINGFAEAGRTDEALYYYRRMEDDGVTANQIVLTSLIKAYSKGGYIEEAKEMYKLMQQFEGGPDIVASNSMISLYADVGIVSEAKLIFDNLRQKGNADGVTFATMMKLYKNMGMLDEASEVAEEMKQSGLLTDCASFNKVMACYATNGQLGDCGELLYDMATLKILPDNSTFKVLFTVLKKGGVPSEAVKQLEACYREGKPYARQAVITCVFSVVGLHAFAIELCRVFTKAGVPLDRFAYNAAIYAYGACGQTEKALNLFMRMQDEGLDPDIVTYIYLVDCYGKASMVEGVKRIYGQLKYQQIEATESLFNAIVNAYRNANRHDLAEVVSQEFKFGFESNQYSVSEIEWESGEET